MRRYRGDVIDYFFLLITFFCAYFIGSFPTSYCVAYYFHGIDIRSYGSGNSGATNMARVLGWRYFFPIVVIDVVKAFACLAIIRSYDGSSEIVMAWVAVALLLGNSFPFYLGFRGGKGVATSVGIQLALLPSHLMWIGSLWCVVLYYVKNVGIASFVTSFMVACCMLNRLFCLGWGIPIYEGVTLFCVLWIMMTHKNNIILCLGDKTESGV